MFNKTILVAAALTAIPAMALDVVFLVDESGSMTLEQQTLRDQIPNIFAGLQLIDPASRAALVGFGTFEEAGDPRLHQALTTDQAAFFTAAQLLQSAGGTEPGFRAIIETASNSVDGKTVGLDGRFCAVIFTDEDSDGSETQAQAQFALASNLGALFSVTNNQADYNNIAVTSYDLSSFSGDTATTIINDIITECSVILDDLTLPPTISPTAAPSTTPTTSPSAVPTTSPSTAPSTTPTTSPSAVPTTSPSTAPSTTPTTSPSTAPSTTPTTSPSAVPTTSPSTAPSTTPTTSPSTAPSSTPTTSPSTAPSTTPTTSPSAAPTSSPSTIPNQSHVTSCGTVMGRDIDSNTYLYSDASHPLNSVGWGIYWKDDAFTGDAVGATKYGVIVTGAKRVCVGDWSAEVLQVGKVTFTMTMKSPWLIRSPHLYVSTVRPTKGSPGLFPYKEGELDTPFDTSNKFQYPNSVTWTVTPVSNDSKKYVECLFSDRRLLRSRNKKKKGNNEENEEVDCSGQPLWVVLHASVSSFGGCDMELMDLSEYVGQAECPNNS